MNTPEQTGKPGKRPESVLVVVFTLEQEILLLQRADDKAFWQSVTGCLEAEEVPIDAARRELLEETGIADARLIDCHYSDSFSIRPQWRHRFQPGSTRNLEHVFLAELPTRCDVSIEPQEHLDYRWVSITQAIEELWSETNRRALEKFVVPIFT